MAIRLASISDANILYEWVNVHDNIRWKYKTTKRISWSTHIKWFHDCLKDKCCKIWIIENDSKENIGQIRIHKRDENAKIDIFLLNDFRGKGHASNSLIAAMSEFSLEHRNIKFEALAHKCNISSINLFKKNGFKISKSIQNKWYKLISSGKG